MAQFRLELGRILKSIIFLLIAAGIVLFAYTQEVFPPDSDITKPEQNGYYGMKPSNDPSLIMPEAAASLFEQYSANKYITYPNGFYKAVRLNQADRKKMAEILSELSVNELSVNELSDVSQNFNINIDAGNKGLQTSAGNLHANEDGSFQVIMPDKEEHTEYDGFQFNSGISWVHFKELMKQADKLLGGGSDFSETWMSHRFGQIPITYEEALADYELVISHDKVTGAYARLFCDYAGIILGLLPVFPAVFLCMCDRKNISPILYTRRISSGRFILVRFSALATATMLPILLMCAVLTCIHTADYGPDSIDVFAYFKYAFFWLFPTAIAAISVGLFFTTLTGTPVAIAIQLIWWFIDIRGGSGMYSFFGVRSFQLIPRHNALGNVEAYLDYMPSLIQNRFRIVLIAALLIVGTIYIFSVKRRGMLYVPIFKRGKIQSAV